MGAKTWMLVYADEAPAAALRAMPALYREASLALAHRLFPGERLEPLPDGSLAQTNPPDDELLVGCFPGVAVVAAKEFAIDHPARLPASFLDVSIGRTIHLHAMHSVVDWLAFAVWRDGQLLRSLSLSPDTGVIEDLGDKLPFEAPYWAGLHPAVDPDDEDAADFPLVFHPLEMGEAALAAFFGYQLEGFVDPSLLAPEDIPLMRFKRLPPGFAANTRPWWKFW